MSQRQNVVRENGLDVAGQNVAVKIEEKIPC